MLRAMNARDESGVAARTSGALEQRACARGLGLRPGEIALVLALGIAFLPALRVLAGEWMVREELSHGPLVPLVSLWAVLRDRRRLARVPVRPDARGAGLLAAGLVIYAIGAGAGLPWAQGLAGIVSVAGAIVWQRGLAWLRALRFPVAFLFFAVPLPADWLAPVVVRLRLLVTASAVRVLHAFAWPIAREGNVLLLPDGSELFVADACSGVTSLLTLTPLAVLLAAFTLRTASRRILLVTSVVPIALAANLVRVLATVAATRRFGLEAATAADAHAAVGLLASLAGCAVLVGVAAALRRTWPES